MPRMIFINIPVTDLARSTAFYEAIGAARNEQLSDATASSMVFSETIHVMLLTHEKFASFLAKPIANARETAQMLLCLSADSRADVDRMVDRAGGGGGRADPCAVQDHGFMYGRSFEDPDGHIWEVMWMDVAAFAAAQAAE